ncbi:MAG: hypothetical protein ACOYBC_05375 [Bilifractor sp.]|jgi:hypothetical protein
MATYFEKGKHQYTMMKNKKTGEIKPINPDHRIGQRRIETLAAKGWTNEGCIVTTQSVIAIRRGLR